MYDEFCPILLNQFKERDHDKFETFDAALDEFYSKIESQRSEHQQKTRVVSAVQKLNKIKTDQVFNYSILIFRSLVMLMNQVEQKKEKSHSWF